MKKDSKRNPEELVRQTLASLSEPSPFNEKQFKETSRNIEKMKEILAAAAQPSAEGDISESSAAEALATAAVSHRLLTNLVSNLDKFSFEAKRDVVYVIIHLLRRQLGAKYPVVEAICTQEKTVLSALLRGYGVKEHATTIGAILRECAQQEMLTGAILESEEFWLMFQHVESFQFDIASDALSTFHALLTTHKELVAKFLEKEYDKFFDEYKKLVSSENFVTKRQSLKLLGELLLDRANFSVMTKYISSAAHLKQIMNVLRDKSRPIQYEAFHVFKVFVANPNKEKPIVDILKRNKEALVMFLENFQNDREDDEQFTDEKTYLISQINAL